MNRTKQLLEIILYEISLLDEGLDYYRCKSYEEFSKNPFVQRAVTQVITNVHETIKKIPEEYIIENKNIDWNKFRTTRNISSHDYMSVSFRVIWNIIQNDIKPFKNDIVKLINDFIDEE